MWGTGKPRREFLHVDDLASAILRLLELDDPPDWVNVGCGEDVSIRELAEMVAETVGFEGEITHDLSKPDGTPRKLMSADRLRELGWSPSIELRDGLADAYNWFLQHEEQIRASS